MKRIVIGLVLGVSFAAGIYGSHKVMAQDQAIKRDNLGFPDLIGGLKSEPGCLGVETARTASGKQVIFAWFKDKDAVLHWYGSKMHQGVMDKFFPATKRREPLSKVKDETGPIMVIASITPSEKERIGTIPISQIAIELYSPLPGGAAVGGRFAPGKVRVDNLLEAPALPKSK